MVSTPMEEGLIYNFKLSSVGPGHCTESDTLFEPTNMDLAMKLHYLRVIYYFGSKAFEGLTTLNIKESMFMWFNQFPVTCGRFRRAELGRAYIKCNDSGARFLEANCVKTLDEWLEIKDTTLEKLLVSNECIGPELLFSPLLFFQLTKFKCGGMAVGLSWAHVLGDAFSVAEFMNILGRVVAGNEPDRPIYLARTLTMTTRPNEPPKVVEDPISVKRVDPVGDNWVHDTKCKMGDFSFYVSPTQLSQLESKLSHDGTQFGPFETLSALVWQCIAKIRGEKFETKVVTICKKGEPNKKYGTLGNNSQVISVVKVDFSIVEADPSDLAALVEKEAHDDRKEIEEAMERDNGLPDFVVYGANLTFVNFEEVEFNEFDFRGQKPVSFGLRIDGVGDEGAILVIPGPKYGGESGSRGRTVVAILPENEVSELKSLLKLEGIMT